MGYTPSFFMMYGGKKGVGCSILRDTLLHNAYVLTDDIVQQTGTREAWTGTTVHAGRTIGLSSHSSV